MARSSPNGRYETTPRQAYGSSWTVTLLFGVICISLYLLVAPAAWKNATVTLPKSQEQTPAPSHAEIQKPSTSRRPASSGQGNIRLGLTPQPPLLAAAASGETGREASVQPLGSAQDLVRLNDLVTQLTDQKKVSTKEAKAIQRPLYELRKQGKAAVPTIREFLRHKGDINFAKMNGGELIEHTSLRQALIETLGKIGGSEAQIVLLEQLSGNLDPAEIALLARTLEQDAPGAYQQEALQAANNALRFWAGPKEQIDARPLFELLRDVGGPEAAAILAQFPATADTVQSQRNSNQNVPLPWKVYSLIALADLPDGTGISSLAALASDPTVPVEHRSTLPFQMLAQSAMDYQDAGKALVDLVRAGQIPDRAWQGVGEVLAGNYWQFPSELSSSATPDSKGTTISSAEAPLMRTYTDTDGQNILKYEQRTVSVGWSAEQVNQQLTFIDELLKATSNPTAQQALQQARASLQGSI